MVNVNQDKEKKFTKHFVAIFYLGHTQWFMGSDLLSFWAWFMFNLSPVDTLKDKLNCEWKIALLKPW